MNELAQRDPELILHRLRSKARQRIKVCLQRTTVDTYQIITAMKSRKYKPEFKLPVNANQIKSIDRDIKAGNYKTAVGKMQDLNEGLERFEKRLEKGMKKSSKYE